MVICDGIKIQLQGVKEGRPFNLRTRRWFWSSLARNTEHHYSMKCYSGSNIAAFLIIVIKYRVVP